MSRYVDLDERVTAQFYDQECEEWTMRTVTIEDVLESVCDDYTVLPSAQPEQRWIPCSDHLPDIKEHHVSEPCIVYCSNGSYAFAELEENIFGKEKL